MKYNYAEKLDIIQKMIETTNFENLRCLYADYAIEHGQPFIHTMREFNDPNNNGLCGEDDETIQEAVERSTKLGLFNKNDPFYKTVSVGDCLVISSADHPVKIMSDVFGFADWIKQNENTAELQA